MRRGVEPVRVVNEDEHRRSPRRRRPAAERRCVDREAVRLGGGPEGERGAEGLGLGPVAPPRGRGSAGSRRARRELELRLRLDPRARRSSPPLARPRSRAAPSCRCRARRARRGRSSARPERSRSACRSERTPPAARRARGKRNRPFGYTLRGARLRPPTRGAAMQVRWYGHSAFAFSGTATIFVNPFDEIEFERGREFGYPPIPGRQRRPRARHARPLRPQRHRSDRRRPPWSCAASSRTLHAGSAW